MVRDAGARAPVKAAPQLDRWVIDLAFPPDDDRKVFVLTEDESRGTLWEVAAPWLAGVRVHRNDLSISDFALGPRGTLVAVGSTSARPPELYRLEKKGTWHPLTHLNDQLGLDLSRFEPLEAIGADGTPIHALYAKPPGFDPSKRYPLLVFIHGGPQGAWLDDFGSLRWSPQLYAARGYVVLMPNPRGSTGFGQAYVDGVNRDWGGKPFDDIMRLYDAAAKLPFVDARRSCALGASFGGFMVNWIQGHTDRFRCLVAHAGLFDQWSMYFQTEELWFPEWEFGGPPWQNPTLYDRFSPSHYADRFKTPELITHGELDFRVPVGEGMGMFTALERRGVPSKLLLFPDEGHWIGKPQNLERWLGSIWAFVDHYLQPDREAGGAAAGRAP
jgi:dipeptidyl aminopeptidase/acylaminoacyl peptidase